MEKEKRSLQDKEKYNVIDTQIASLGRFQIKLDIVSESGKNYPYSYIRIGKSVGVLAFFDDKVILIRQYRHSLKEYIYEIPGGGVRQHENLMEAAKRELIEETGYIADEISLLGTYYPSPGSSDEMTYLYVARCSKCIQPQTEPLEYIATNLVAMSDFKKMISTGTFKHSMGIVAYMYYLKGYYDGEEKNAD